MRQENEVSPSKTTTEQFSFQFSACVVAWLLTSHVHSTKLRVGYLVSSALVALCALSASKRFGRRQQLNTASICCLNFPNCKDLSKGEDHTPIPSIVVISRRLKRESVVSLFSCCSREAEKGGQTSEE